MSANDAMMGSTRPRWAPSDAQRAILEESYTEVSSFPDLGRRHLLASELGIETRQVQVWFQNRRQKAKKKSGLESMYITEPDDCRGEPSRAPARPPSVIKSVARIPFEVPNEEARQLSFAFRMIDHRTSPVQSQSSAPRSELGTPPTKQHTPSEALNRDISNQAIRHLLAQHADEKAQLFKNRPRMSIKGLVSHALRRPMTPRPPTTTTIPTPPLAANLSSILTPL